MDKAKIESLILDGYSLAEIGRRHGGVSRQWVHQKCKRYGINLQELRDERDRRLLSQITQYAKDGYTIGDVAHLLSLRYSKVQKLAHQNGVKFTASQQRL